MSWDLLIIKFDGALPRLEELGNDFIPPKIGSAEQVRQQIAAQLPQVEWSEPGYGHYSADGFQSHLV